jgi:hypothetical protein
VVVRPGEDIQAAIDSLPESGGCVCLKVGDHEIQAPLRIEQSNVSLHGESWGARIIRSDGVELLRIEHANGLLVEGVTVSGISFHVTMKESSPAGLMGLVTVNGCRRINLENCILDAVLLTQGAALIIGQSMHVKVHGCRIDRLQYGICSVSDTSGLEIVDNHLDALVDDTTDAGFIGFLLQDVSQPARIENNRVLGYFVGIALNNGIFGGVPFSLAANSSITCNTIVRMGASLEEGTLKAFGIDVAADDCIVSHNNLVYPSPEYGGIRAHGNNTVIEENKLRSELPEAGIGIHPVGIVLSNAVLGSRGGRIAANHLDGVQDGIVLIANDGADVHDNWIGSDKQPVRFGILTVSSKETRVLGNRVSNARWAVATSQGTAQSFRDNILVRGNGGFTCLTHASLTCSGNRIEDMRHWGAISLAGSGKLAFTQNRLLSCGYEQQPSMGLGVSLHVGELAVESCEIMDTGLSPNKATISQLAYAVFADLVLEARIQSNLITYTDTALLDHTKEHRALWLRGWLEQDINVGAGPVVVGFSAQVLDNKFIGPGKSALVEVAQLIVTNLLRRRFERVVFNNNFCWHMSVAAASTATVSLLCRSAVVMGNHFKILAPIPSVDFHGLKDAVYMGNIAQSHPANFGGIPAALSGFNKP